MSKFDKVIDGVLNERKEATHVVRVNYTSEQGRSEGVIKAKQLEGLTPQEVHAKATKAAPLRAYTFTLVFNDDSVESYNADTGKYLSY